MAKTRRVGAVARQVHTLTKTSPKLLEIGKRLRVLLFQQGKSSTVKTRWETGRTVNVVEE